jgi:hypothetical protein
MDLDHPTLAFRLALRSCGRPRGSRCPVTLLFGTVLGTRTALRHLLPRSLIGWSLWWIRVWPGCDSPMRYGRTLLPFRIRLPLWKLLLRARALRMRRYLDQPVY